MAVPIPSRPVPQADYRRFGEVGINTGFCSKNEVIRKPDKEKRNKFPLQY